MNIYKKSKKLHEKINDLKYMKVNKNEINQINKCLDELMHKIDNFSDCCDNTLKNNFNTTEEDPKTTEIINKFLPYMILYSINNP